MANSRRIRVLVDDGGRKVWKVFDGAWLGTISPDGTIVLGVQADTTTLFVDDPNRWCVARGVHGNFAVYRYNVDEKLGQLQVFESVESMRTHVPERILTAAEIEAGIRPRPEGCLSGGGN